MMPFRAALMYAEKYKLAEVCSEEREQLQAALRVAEESARIRNESVEHLKAAISNKSNEVSQVKIALKSEESLHEITQEKLKKQKKIIYILGGVIAIETILLLK